jgi:hypothetical protein
MPDFEELLSSLRDGIKELVEQSWSEYKTGAAKDAKAFLEKTKGDIKRWTDLVAEGKLTISEFEFLLKAKRDLATLEALKQAGLTAVRLNKFRNDLFATIVKVVKTAIV